MEDREIRAALHLAPKVGLNYAGPPFRDRQAWLGTVEHLDLALLAEAILPQIRALPTGRR